MSCIWFVGRVEENVSERDVCTIEELSKVAITVKEILKVENRRIAHWVTG